MELTVQLRSKLWIIGRGGKLLVDLREVCDLGFGRMPSCEACHDPFQFFAHGIKLEDLLHGKNRNRHASAGGRLEQALFLKSSESLADRRPADAESHGDFLLPEGIARMVNSVANCRQDRLVRALSARP